MPLTPAEKMKRYREKLKKDTEKYEEYKKKDLARMKIKTKKISEMTEDEKEHVRKKWRDLKRNQKNKKKVENKSDKKETQSAQEKRKKSSVNKYVLLIRKWKRAYTSLSRKCEDLQRKVSALRKKLYRTRKRNASEVEKLNDLIMKKQAREEVLECAIQNAYKNTNKHEEKRVFKNVFLHETKKTYVSKLLGLKGRVRIQMKQIRQSEKIKQEIEPFFLRDDISRITAGKKETKTKKKEKHQIRYLTDTLKNLYQIYRDDGGQYSFVTFYRNKPFYVLTPNIQNRDSCLCIKHCNTELLFSALIKNKAFTNEIKTLNDVLAKLSCDVKSYDCMYGRCETCKLTTLDFALEGEILSKRIQWEQWERIDHTYDKMEGRKLVQKTTKKTVKTKKSGTLEELIQTFMNKIGAFKIHYFNWKHQQYQYREKIANLSPTEALILCDFSENYECKLNEEVQASHFIKSQVTLHCGMIYWANKCQSFCSISDNKCHEPSAIWAHLLPVIKLIKNCTPEVKTIHFHSDGPSSQYRQKKNFFLLNHYTTKLGFDFCTWNFSESGHGKGVADGIGGAVKRTLDKQVAYGQDVTDGRDAFEILRSVSKSIKFFIIPDSEIYRIDQSFLLRNLKAVPGTLQIHQIISHAHSCQIQHRVLSCFCRLDNDQVCECYSLKKHKFPANITIDAQSTGQPSTSKACNVNLNESGPENSPLELISTCEDNADINFEIDYPSNSSVLISAKALTITSATSASEKQSIDKPPTSKASKVRTIKPASVDSGKQSIDKPSTSTSSKVRTITPASVDSGKPSVDKPLPIKTFKARTMTCASSASEKQSIDKSPTIKASKTRIITRASADSGKQPMDKPSPIKTSEAQTITSASLASEKQSIDKPPTGTSKARTITPTPVDCGKSSAASNETGALNMDITYSFVEEDQARKCTFSTMTPAANDPIFDIASATVTLDCMETLSSTGSNLANISVIDPSSMVKSDVSNNFNAPSSAVKTIDSVPDVPVIDLTVHDSFMTSSTNTDSLAASLPVKIDLTNLSLNFNNIKQSPKRKLSTKSDSETPKKKAQLTEKEHITASNKNRSIRTVVSRCLKCTLCKESVPFNSSRIIKCMVCSKWYCATCTEGQVFFDYICSKCLQ